MKRQNIKRIFSYLMLLSFLIVIVQFICQLVNTNTRSNVDHHKLNVDQVMIVIKTSWKNYETRLNSILSTWYRFAPLQV